MKKLLRFFELDASERRAVMAVVHLMGAMLLHAPAVAMKEKAVLFAGH